MKGAQSPPHLQPPPPLPLQAQKMLHSCSDRETAYESITNYALAGQLRATPPVTASAASIRPILPQFPNGPPGSLSQPRLTPLFTTWRLSAGLTLIDNIPYDRREFIAGLEDTRYAAIDALSTMFLDIDYVRLPEQQRMSAYVLRQARVPEDEAHLFLFEELFPILAGNLLDIAGEWRGWNADGLEVLVQERRHQKKVGFAKLAHWLWEGFLYLSEAGYIEECWDAIRKDMEFLRMDELD